MRILQVASGDFFSTYGGGQMAATLLWVAKPFLKVAYRIYKVFK